MEFYKITLVLYSSSIIYVVLKFHIQRLRRFFNIFESTLYSRELLTIGANK